MQKGIIDRFEGAYAVIEFDGKTEDVLRSELPAEVKAGDKLIFRRRQGPFSHNDFIYEPKIDGHRLIYTQQSGRIRLYTHHNNECTQQYPELHLPFADDVILDGEVACVDSMTGVSDFESNMSRF
jgi:hypothetical protein